VWDAKQEARSTTTTRTDNDNSGEVHDISGDDGIHDGGPGRDRDSSKDLRNEMYGYCCLSIFPVLLPGGE